MKDSPGFKPRRESSPNKPGRPPSPVLRPPFFSMGQLTNELRQLRSELETLRSEVSDLRSALRQSRHASHIQVAYVMRQRLEIDDRTGEGLEGTFPVAKARARMMHRKLITPAAGSTPAKYAYKPVDDEDAEVEIETIFRTADPEGDDWIGPALAISLGSGHWTLVNQECDAE